MQAKQEQYQSIMWSLMFSIIETLPDITLAISVMNCFAKNLSRQHTEVLKTIMQYFKVTYTHDIIYGGDGRDLIIKRHSNSDWIGDHTLKKSNSRFIFILNRDLVSWSSKKQATIALSSIKAKYVALTFTTKEVIWMRLLFIEIGLLNIEGLYIKIKVLKDSKRAEQIKANIVRQEGEVLSFFTNITSPTSPTNTMSSISLMQAPIPISLKRDNQGSIALAHNLVFHSHIKHIHIQNHYIRNKVANG